MAIQEPQNHSKSKKLSLDNSPSIQKPTIHIGRSSKFYWGIIIFCILFMLSEILQDGNFMSQIFRRLSGIIPIILILFAVYKLAIPKGEIIFTDSSFKVAGYDWKTWDELIAVYPFVESDSETDQHFIRFRLTDGTDLSIRSGKLSMSFEQIAELVNSYKHSYQQYN